MLVAINKLTNINSSFSRAIKYFQNSKAISFSLAELSFEDVFSILILYALSSFFSLSIHEDLPSSKEYSPFIV